MTAKRFFAANSISHLKTSSFLGDADTTCIHEAETECGQSKTERNIAACIGWVGMMRREAASFHKNEWDRTCNKAHRPSKQTCRKG